MSGNICSKEENVYHIDELFKDADEINPYYCYALYDMNGDSVPELHIRAVDGYYIFTCVDGVLLLWNIHTHYSWPTGNRAVLLTRNGGAPPHISYRYDVFDYYGNSTLTIFFEKYDINYDGIYDDEDFYIFEGVEVSMETWNKLTNKYLSDETALIQWKGFRKGKAPDF